MYWYYWVIVAVCALFSMFFSAADMVYGMVDKDKLAREKGIGLMTSPLSMFTCCGLLYEAGLRGKEAAV